MSDATQLAPAGPGRYALRGELGRDSVPALLAAGERVFASGERIELDLTAVGRVDSVGVALLVEWLRRARATGGDLGFSGIPPQMLAILQVCDLEDVLGLEAASADARVTAG